MGWRVCFETLGGNDRVLVVMSVGGMADALDGLPSAPDNFILRSVVPQLELLSRCSAFVTHGGANSMHEGLSFGVPLVVIPLFGDQPTNGDSVAQCGAGVTFGQPLSTLNAEALCDAMCALLEDGSSNKYVASARTMYEKLRSAGGVPAAANIIMQQAGAPPVNWLGA